MHQEKRVRLVVRLPSRRENMELSKSKPRWIDVHHHVVLPEYERALVHSGAGDPSRPLRKNSDPQAELNAMDALGISEAVLISISVAGIHHGDDANAGYLTESTNEALAKFVSFAPKRLGF